jgi:hypothetical protein
LPFSAIDAMSPAFEHTKRQLLQPFRFGQWARLAVVGLLAGELSSGGCNTNYNNFNLPQHPGGTGHFLPSGLAGTNPALFAALIVVIVVAALVLSVVLMYISSVMRFILFDSVLAMECHIRQGWSRRQGPGWNLFVWKLLFTLATFAAMIVVVGIPVGFAFVVGWLKEPREHVLALVLGGILLFFTFFILIIAISVIYVLTKDFVVPQMALEDIGVMEGWRRLWPMMKAEKGGYAAYVGMKIVLAIGAAIILGIASIIGILIIMIPAAAVAIAAVLAGKAAGLGWTFSTIALAVVAGCALLVVLIFVIALISVPAIVFFPAYSMYFFAARYPALSTMLYPPPAAPAAPEVPPYEPPPLPPEPAPIG